VGNAKGNEAGNASDHRESTEYIMTNVAILYCKRFKDHSCVGCAKCYKGMKEKNGEFGRHDEVNLVAMTDCGDCPGLTVPRVKLLSEITKNLDRPIEVLHLGTCVKVAMETAQCPIDFDSLKPTLEKKFGCQVVLGTHSY
jgi:predicted metal-binding protein